jgi:NAD(P)-dependent dehydrogenase (short-subunit alcohol dehydrogenase family)
LPSLPEDICSVKKTQNKMKQTHNLENKRVILLGASSGFGLATAHAAAAAGAEVVIVSGNQSRIDEALKQLPAGTEGHAADLRSEANIKAFFEQAGKFDHLVYTAGESLEFSPIDQTELEAARKRFDIRFWGAFAAIKYGSPNINAGGSITLTSGTAGTRPPGKGWGIAAAICTAVEGLVRGMAAELAPIRINSVVAGLVDTNLWSNLPEADRKGMLEHYGSVLPVGRVGAADDIAQTFLYLMKQGYCTGQNLIVDGGGVLA